MKGIKINLLHEGAMLINKGYIEKACGNVIAIQIDMKSKRGEATDFGAYEVWNLPYITVNSVLESVHLNPDVHKDVPTIITFPDYEGWTVWTAHVSKYTIYACLIKK